MKKSRFTEEHIVRALMQAEAGTPVREVCRKLQVTEQTYYRWRKAYGGMQVSQAKRMKELEKENQHLRRAVANLTVGNLILKEASKGRNF